MLSDLLFLDLMTTQDEFEMCLKQLSDAKKFGMIDEFMFKADKLLIETNNIPKAMHSAWYDLFIDSDTGKFKEEFEKLIPKPGKNINY